MASYFTRADKWDLISPFSVGICAMLSANDDAFYYSTKDGKRKRTGRFEQLKAEETLFGVGEEDDYRFHKPFFPKFVELGTREAFLDDMAALYAKLAVLADRAMIELPLLYAPYPTMDNKTNKYTAFVDAFHSTNNDMQELHRICKLLSCYEGNPHSS